MTKDAAQRVRESQARRREVLDRFGFVPLSVLSISRGSLSRRMRVLQKERPSTRTTASTETRLGAGRAAKLREQYAGVKDSGQFLKFWGCPQTGRTALSVMPAELVDFFLKFYADPGDVYLDPFIGQGIRMQVAHLRGFEYRGLDLCEEFMGYVGAVRDDLGDDPPIEVYLADSRTPTMIPDGVGGFCFTSPPYWDIEDYGPAPGQLGSVQTYQDFLAGMEKVARAWLPKFRPGAYVCVNVNDFRKGGVFYPYHADCIALYQRAGWAFHDLWVVQNALQNVTRMFAVDKVRHRVAPKVHEYVLVFRAP